MDEKKIKSVRTSLLRLARLGRINKADIPPPLPRKKADRTQQVLSDYLEQLTKIRDSISPAPATAKRERKAKEPSEPKAPAKRAPASARSRRRAPAPKEAKQEPPPRQITLQEHQKLFASHFMSNPVRGAMAIHGVGTGKTLTAVLVSQLFLNANPTAGVFVITPASLLAGFKKELYDYIPDAKNDDRYHFFTYDQYSRLEGSGDPRANCRGGLLIVDEAQNLRTHMDIKEASSIDDDGKLVISQIVKSGRKVYNILKGCAMKAKKVLLLSATPMVNSPDDIENLMAMINGHTPLPRTPGGWGSRKSGTLFDLLKQDPRAMARYFGCRLSFFENPTDQRIANFPAVQEVRVPIVMSEKSMLEYNLIRVNQPDERHKSLAGKSKEQLEAFYSGLRNISNSTGDKVKFIMALVRGVSSKTPNQNIGLTQEILDSHTDKIVIFTQFLGSGSDLVAEMLEKEGFKFGEINGSVSKKRRAEIVADYVDGKINIIFISKAGAEGLNLLKTGYIVLMEPSWNETQVEQVKGRGVRYKSHADLPEHLRNVMILQLYLIYPNEEQHFGKIMDAVDIYSGEFEKAEAEKEAKGEARAVSQVKGFEDFTGGDITYLMTGQKPGYMPQWAHESYDWFEPYEEKVAIQLKESLGSDRLSALGRLGDDPTDRRARGDAMVVKAELFQFEPGLGKMSIDVRIALRSLEKQWTIRQAMKELKKIESVEECKSTGEALDIAGLFEVKREPGTDIPPPDDWEKKFYEDKYPFDPEPERDTDKIDIKELKSRMVAITRTVLGENKDLVRLQNAFFTPPNIARDMIQFSGIGATKHKILFLEPTAGAGFLIYEALLASPKVFCDAYENLEVMAKFLENFPRTRLMSERNFMNASDDIKYPVIIMNPPFNIAKGKGLAERATKDVDFVLKAWQMLERPGILVCLISVSYEFRGTEAKQRADRDVYQPFRDLLDANEHSILKYEDGFTGKAGAVAKALETGVRMRLIKIFKK